MLKFIEKSEYEKPTYIQTSPNEIRWVYVQDDLTHSGIFIKGQKSNHLRDDEEFEPFAEVVSLGLVPNFDQAAYDAQIAAEQKEAARISLKNQRNRLLQSITYSFSDGRSVQVRPQDVSNFQMAISMNINTEWVMSDNTVSELTVAELTEALNHGISEGQRIYVEYMSELKLLNES